MAKIIQRCFAMLKEPTPRQHTLEMVILEDLVPTDHLLRKIDKYIDFEFIRDQVRHLYCDNNGRPAVDPVLLFKILFIGYLFGVRSERQLVREVQVNCGLPLVFRLEPYRQNHQCLYLQPTASSPVFGNRY
jgi:transposase